MRFTPEKPPLAGETLESLTAAFGERGEKPYRARQVLEWYYKKRARSWEEMTNLPKALRAWLGAPRLVADVAMIPEEQEPAISRDGQGIRVSLPFSWIPDVYCRGLSVLLGHFVLRIARATETELALDAVGSDLQTTQVISIRL